MMKINNNFVDVLLFVEKIEESHCSALSRRVLYLNVLPYRYLGLRASETPEVIIIFGV